MIKPMISIYDHLTGETELREMTNAEIAFMQTPAELPENYVVEKQVNEAATL